MMRPSPSMPPPGVNGTISFTNRVGQGAAACARAGRVANVGAAADAAESATRWRRVIMIVLLCIVRRQRANGRASCGCTARYNLSNLSFDPDASPFDNWVPLVDIGPQVGCKPVGG